MTCSANKCKHCYNKNTTTQSVLIKPAANKTDQPHVWQCFYRIFNFPYRDEFWWNQWDEWLEKTLSSIDVKAGHGTECAGNIERTQQWAGIFMVVQIKIMNMPLWD